MGCSRFIWSPSWVWRKVPVLPPHSTSIGRWPSSPSGRVPKVRTMLFRVDFLGSSVIRSVQRPLFSKINGGGMVHNPDELIVRVTTGRDHVQSSQLPFVTNFPSSTVTVNTKAIFLGGTPERLSPGERRQHQQPLSYRSSPRRWSLPSR